MLIYYAVSDTLVTERQDYFFNSFTLFRGLFIACRRVSVANGRSVLRCVELFRADQ